jgi:hypothetical protein
VNEWGFAGEIKSWWDSLIRDEPGLQLGRVTIEETQAGESLRADLTLYDAHDRRLLVFELRLPDHAQPDPNDMANITAAASKAMQAGARWSATSDAATVRLLDHSRPEVKLRERAVPIPPLATAATRQALDIPAKRAEIRSAWLELLRTLAPVLLGRASPPPVPPDEFFVEALKASLFRPFQSTRDEMSRKAAAENDFLNELIRWMVDEQGWPHDPRKIEDEIAHVAEVVTYVFATRLLFYGAMRRANPGLHAIDLPESGDAAFTQKAVEWLFEQARASTQDYITVFAFDDVSRWALISTESCLGWREVLSVLDHFELESIGYDVLGRLFEQLIDPHERYEWGQHYTAPDVVDLMLALALPEGRGYVADFASGGGTFLVRAYTRKKAFEPQASHEQRLRQIAGGDISAFAVSVATVSLASQSLAAGSNYPQIRVGSFFAVRPGQQFVELPSVDAGVEARTLPPLDAVVCNPPYIAHSKIGRHRLGEAVATYAAEWPSRPRLAGKWNYHIPFWFHSASFLAPGGRLAFITSGEWYDSDYGAQLQDWLTSTFHVELVIESMAEQWFGEARVGTVVLIARRLERLESKSNLLTRFVTLRKPLAKLYGADTTDDTTRLLSVDAFRDRLLELEGAGQGDEFDHVVVKQEELRAEGVVDGRYLGSTWRSRYLRSPAIARELDSRTDYAALRDLAIVDLGIKTGADGFFFLDDEGPAPEAGRRRVKGWRNWSGKIGRANLLPAIRNPHDLDDGRGGRFLVVQQRKLPSWYFAPGSRVRDAGAHEYIAYGEQHQIHEQDLVRSNAGERWYVQTRNAARASWVLPYNSAYDYFAAYNRRARAVLNGRFVGVEPRDAVDSELLGAVLNSTFATVARLLVGVSTGNEGAYDVGPPAARLMRLPDPRLFSETGSEKVRVAFNAIRSDGHMQPAPAGDGSVTTLRRDLDRAILVALGSSAGDAEVLLDRLYDGYRRWRQAVKVVELQVQRNRQKLAARGGDRQRDPIDLAARSILDEIRPKYTVDATVFSGLRCEWYDATPAREDSQEALLERTTVSLRDRTVVDLGTASRVRLVAEMRWMGLTGELALPLDAHRIDVFLDELRTKRAGLDAAAAERARIRLGEHDAPRVVERVGRLWASEVANHLKEVLPNRNEDRDHHHEAEVVPALFGPKKLVPPAL